MKEIIKLGITLLLVCIVAAFALAMTNEVTKDTIKENVIKANTEARQEVFSDADEFVLIALKDTESDIEFEAHPNAESFLKDNKDVAEVYKAMSAGNHVGFVIKTLPSGYGGALEVIIGFDLEGTITGVRVGNHQETPGLGANAKTPEFYTQYNGLSVTSPVEVTKVEVTEGANEIQAISGATITSKAVTVGVNYGQAVLEAFK